MGCSNSKDKDLFSLVLQKHGEDEVKELILATSRVQFIESNRQAILNSLQQKIQNTCNSLMHQVELLKTEIDKKYERSITKIQQANPKAMVAAQKTFKTKIQELMGYKDVMKKYNEYKEQARLNLQREESHTISYLTNFLKEYQESQEQEIPNLKKFRSLDDDDQEDIIKAGKKKYKTAVKKVIDKVQGVIQEKCAFENFEPKFKAIVTKEKQVELMNLAERLFMMGEEKVKGASDCKTC